MSTHQTRTSKRRVGALATTSIVLSILGAFAFACSAGEVASPSNLNQPNNAVAVAAPEGLADASSITANEKRPFGAPPKDVVDLFETRMLPTCSLNNGVCHNANNYPDLRNVAALEDLTHLPCGMNVEENFPDVCEPPGDHIVAAGGSIDAEIETLTVDEKSSTATLLLASDITPPTSGTLTSVKIRRDEYGSLERTFDGGGSSGDGGNDIESGSVSFVATDARHVIVKLGAGVTPGTRAFFFAPRLPLREDHLRPADVNGNGIRGRALGFREIVPGRPQLSYLVARLWDTSINAELMPRQCRTWGDEATRALGCWIEGLKTDPAASGNVTNFYDPIDYAACTFDVPRAGRCGTGLTVDQVFSAECTGCHQGSQSPQGLDLGASVFRASIVNRSSRENPAMLLVAPGNPDASYLYAKLVGVGPASGGAITGDLMPRNGGRLSKAQLETVRAWIASGAP